MQRSLLLTLTPPDFHDIEDLMAVTCVTQTGSYRTNSRILSWILDGRGKGGNSHFNLIKGLNCLMPLFLSVK
jgi:hypothetical protein